MTKWFYCCPPLLLVLIWLLYLGSPSQLLTTDISTVEQSIFAYITLPTSLMAMLVGALLASSGTLIQASLNNDFASPSTLGIGSGALLGSLLTQLIWPQVDWLWIWLASFLVSLLLASVVTLLSQFIGGGRLNLVLIGMAISIGVGALCSYLMIYYEQKFDGMFLWGSGQVAQVSNELVQQISWPALLILLVPLLLVPKLELLLLGKGLAGHLGLNVARWRLGFLLLAVISASLATSLVGLIGFVGLMAPHLARYCGAHRLYLQLPLAMCLGAILVLAADGFSILLVTGGYRLPTGVLTVLLGCPFFIALLLLSKSRFEAASETKSFGIEAIFRCRPQPLLLSLIALVSLSIGFLIHITGYAEMTHLRVWLALFVGMALASSGAVLQTLLRNPMASPDISGVSSSSVLFVALGLLFFPSFSAVEQVLLSLLGAAVVLALLTAVIKLNLSIAQLALFGVALSALSGTVTTLVLAMGSSRGGATMLWLSGSTYGAGEAQLAFIACAAVGLLGLLMLVTHKLDLLTLSGTLPRHLGLNQQGLLLLALLLVGVLIATAVAVAGNIGFVGLLAPHIIRLLGVNKHRYLLPCSALLGGLLLIWADAFGRLWSAPFEVPAGIVVSVLGSVYFIILVLVGYRRTGKS